MRRRHLDPDDADARVVLSSIMDTVPQIPEPCPQVRAVVLFDKGPVRDEVGRAADRGPLTRVVQKADVDMRVAGEIVGLARLGVGMKEQINAASFLEMVELGVSLFAVVHG